MNDHQGENNEETASRWYEMPTFRRWGKNALPDIGCATVILAGLCGAGALVERCTGPTPEPAVIQKTVVPEAVSLNAYRVYAMQHFADTQGRVDGMTLMLESVQRPLVRVHLNDLEFDGTLDDVVITVGLSEPVSIPVAEIPAWNDLYLRARASREISYR